jgi:hypothetical protein
MSLTHSYQPPSKPIHIPTPTHLRALRQQKESLQASLEAIKNSLADIDVELALLDETFHGIKEIKKEVLLHDHARAAALAVLLDSDLPDNTPIHSIKGIPLPIITKRSLTLVNPIPIIDFIKCHKCESKITPPHCRIGVTSIFDDDTYLHWYHEYVLLLSRRLTVVPRNVNHRASSRRR